MSKPLPTFQDVLLARRTIAPYLPPTPLHHYPQLDTLLGASVFVKHENYQPIGAFKVRGGINFMAHLAPAERQRGVVTASTGNHGQSVAYAAQLFGVSAVIVVPEGANPVKVNAMRAYGAEVVFHGADFEASKRHCLTLEREQGLRFVSSGDEPLLIAGVAGLLVSFYFIGSGLREWRAQGTARTRRAQRSRPAPSRPRPQRQQQPAPRRERKPAPPARSAPPSEPAAAGAASFCHNCGAPIDGNDRFCRQCGTAIRGR